MIDLKSAATTCRLSYNIGVVNKLDRRRRRRGLLTTRSTCRGEIFYVRSLERSSREKCSCCFEMPKFPHNTMSDRCKEAAMPKTCLIRPDVLAYDGQTDGRTDGHMTTAYAALCGVCRASIASRGKNDISYTTGSSRRYYRVVRG